jgi:hypothetical protein
VRVARGVLALAVLGVALLAMWQSPARQPVASQAALPTQAAEPTGVPTRVPLPTLGPEMVISRIVRETPTPAELLVATPPSDPRVFVVDFGYQPGRMQVSVGTRVTWLNAGHDGHDVTGNGPGGAWRSGPLAPTEQYARQFGIVGTYDYACTVHPEMRGQVQVVDVQR